MNTFEKLRVCYDKLSKADPKQAYSDEAYRMSLLKIFNSTFGFAYKVMADVLTQNGVNVDPDDQEAFFKICAENGFIDDVAVWLQMQSDRNMSLFIYNEKTTAEILVRVITSYIPVLGRFVAMLESHINA